MTRVLLPVVALIVLALAALNSLPARLLPRLVDGDTLRLAGLSGTVLEGSATRALVRTPAGFVHLGRVSWQVHPMSLLRFSPRVTLDSRWGAQRVALDLRLDGQRMVLEELEANVDAQLLRTLMPVAAAGRISLQFEHLILDRGLPLQAEGRVVWQDARWQAPQVTYDLGTYVAVVTGDEVDQSGEVGAGGLRARIETLAGPVSAEGSASLVGSLFDVDVLIRGAGQPMERELDQALRLIARPEEDGYRLRLDGSFAPAS